MSGSIASSILETGPETGEHRSPECFDSVVKLGGFELFVAKSSVTTDNTRRLIPSHSTNKWSNPTKTSL
jgi:hypothetical protein